MSNKMWLMISNVGRKIIVITLITRDITALTSEGGVLIFYESQICAQVDTQSLQSLS